MRPPGAALVFSIARLFSSADGRPVAPPGMLNEAQVEGAQGSRNWEPGRASTEPAVPLFAYRSLCPFADSKFKSAHRELRKWNPVRHYPLCFQQIHFARLWQPECTFRKRGAEAIPSQPSR